MPVRGGGWPHPAAASASHLESTSGPWASSRPMRTRVECSPWAPLRTLELKAVAASTVRALHFKPLFQIRYNPLSS